jgi:hypothetical protein
VAAGWDGRFRIEEDKVVKHAETAPFIVARTVGEARVLFRVTNEYSYGIGVGKNGEGEVKMREEGTEKRSSGR